MTGKQRMLNAYRGIRSDRIAIAPEFWYYYPAKVMGVDMIEFERKTPFHLALKTTFEAFDCEWWGAAFGGPPHPTAETKSREEWVDKETLEVTSTTRTSLGELTSTQRYHREEPSWAVSRPVKDWNRDLPVYIDLHLGGNLSAMNCDPMIKARDEVGETFLLEAWLGNPFFDFIAGGREGGLEQAIFDFVEHESLLEELQERYIDFMVRKAREFSIRTPFESLAIGCSWSCNSLIGPNLWRKWDKPVIQAVADEIHRHGKLLHIHFHGRCMETLRDFAEIGIDSVCPFERPPGGDVEGLSGLKEVAEALNGRVTMNGNIHTVETLIRGTADDVRREVREVMEAFAGNPRVILGTGDQVGRETPEENLHAMINEAKSIRW